MKKTSIIALGVVLVAGLLFAFYLKNKKISSTILDESTTQAQRVRKKIYDYDLQKCPGASQLIKSEDVYMRGLVEQGQEVEVIMNYFKCQRPERGDIVLYRFSEFDNPVIKRMVGLPGDKFEVIDTKQGWMLKVNDKFITGIKGENYFFGGHLPPPLALAAKAKKGILGASEVIVFSSFPPGDKDSGVFGVISLNDVVGKIEGKGNSK